MDYVEYRIKQIKGFAILFALSLFACISIGCLILILVVQNIWAALFLFPGCLLLPFFIAVIRAGKIRFNKDYIELVTLFKTKRIQISEVNKFGVFIAGRNTWPRVTSQSSIDHYNLDEPLYGYFIYLSTNHEFDLDRLRPMKNVCFPYRRNWYFKVKAMLEKESYNSDL